MQNGLNHFLNFYIYNLLHQPQYMYSSLKDKYSKSRKNTSPLSFCFSLCWQFNNYFLISWSKLNNVTFSMFHSPLKAENLSDLFVVPLFNVT